MTLAEARYVVAHRELYDDRTLRWALDIIEQAEREAPRAEREGW